MDIGLAKKRVSTLSPLHTRPNKGYDHLPHDHPTLHWTTWLDVIARPAWSRIWFDSKQCDWFHNGSALLPIKKI